MSIRIHVEVMICDEFLAISVTLVILRVLEILLEVFLTSDTT